MARGSPLMSPSVGDQSGIKALNLDPSCPQVSADVIRLVFFFTQVADFSSFICLLAYHILFFIKGVVNFPGTVVFFVEAHLY